MAADSQHAMRVWCQYYINQLLRRQDVDGSQVVKLSAAAGWQAGWLAGWLVISVPHNWGRRKKRRDCTENWILADGLKLSTCVLRRVNVADVAAHTATLMRSAEAGKLVLLS